MLLFVGRIQPLKAPDVLRARGRRDGGRDPVAARHAPGRRVRRPLGLRPGAPARARGTCDRARRPHLVRFVPPVDRVRLADWYRAADVCVVPSYSESFGLVAVEVQACGTPVVAARVGGLPTAVADGVSGLLVDGHDPQTWGRAPCDVVGDRDRLERWSQAAVGHALRFGWDAAG
ncbi:MAG: glycosyltransferase [Candidatus Nanopelagicales bacterium]